MGMRNFSVYLALLGAIACGPGTPRKEPTVFRIDTDECRITEAETPWLDIEVRYGKFWTSKGRYNSALKQTENVQHNHAYFGEDHDESRLYGYARRTVTQCAENDPERQKRPIGFVLAGSNK